MKSTTATLAIGFAFGLAAFSAVAIAPISPDPNFKPSPITLGSVKPELLKALVVDSMNAKDTPSRHVQIDNISCPGNDPKGHVMACTVKARLQEGSGLNGGVIKSTEVTYYVRHDLQTGKADIAQVDVAAARDLAITGLAEAVFDTKPVFVTPDLVRFEAVTKAMKGMNCTVEVSKVYTAGMPQWLLSKVDCKRSTTVAKK